MKARIPVVVAALAAAGLAPVAVGLTPAPARAANWSTGQHTPSPAGGSYTVDLGSGAGSVFDLPLAVPGQFTPSPIDWGPSS
jgi:hypothetical protein